MTSEDRGQCNPKHDWPAALLSNQAPGRARDSDSTAAKAGGGRAAVCTPRLWTLVSREESKEMMGSSFIICVFHL